MAILELKVTEQDEIFSLSVSEEKHYKLVPKGQIDTSDLQDYLAQDSI